MSIGRRVRPYFATASMGATAGIGEHPIVLLDHAIALLRLAVLVLIWRAIEPDVVPYIVLVQLLYQQLDVRTEVLNAIWEGTVASRLLRPVSVFGDYLAEMVGGWALRWITFSIPALALALALDVPLAPASATTAAIAAASLALSIAVGAAVDFLLALAVIGSSENMWALRFAREQLVPVVSGAVIPLTLLPWHLGDILGVLPFASMVAAPVRIYTGDPNVVRLLALQVAWTAILWPATRYAWRRAAPTMVSFGG